MSRQLLTLGASLTGIATAVLTAAIWRKNRGGQSSLFALKKIELDGKILLEWEDTGALYRIYKEGERMYEGRGPCWCDESPGGGEIVRYEVECLGEKRSERAIVQVMRKQSHPDDDDPLASAFANTIVTENRIIIFWEPIDGLDEYQVYKNGNFIKTIKEAQFIDEEVGEGENLYTFAAERPIKKSEIQLAEEKYTLAKAFGLLKKRTKEKASMERFYVMKKIGPRQGLFSGKKAKVDGNVQFRYTTFLPEKWLKNPNFFSMKRYFQGDGRGFEPDHPRFRTRVDIICSDSDIHMRKEINKTKAFDWIRRFHEAGRADDSQIVLDNPLTDEKGATFILRHTAGNPLTVSPDIDYIVKAAFLRNGLFDVSGKHDQSPNHEVYIKRGNMDWEPIHQADSKGLAWMAEPLASQYWRISNLE